MVAQSRCRTVPAIWNQAASSSAPHNPKVAGSNPAPATKKALGIPTCAEGFLAYRGCCEAAIVDDWIRRRIRARRAGGLDDSRRELVNVFVVGSTGPRPKVTMCRRHLCLGLVHA